MNSTIMDKDLVSVCVPTFNGDQFIKQTLESILGQTYDHLEVIIQDDGSTDNTMEIVRSFTDPRLTVRTSPENLGGASNWNAATSSYRGKYLKVVCQDDLLDKDCIEQEVRTLDANPEAAFCWSRRRIINHSGKTIMISIGGRSNGEIQYFHDGIRKVVRSGKNPFGEPCCVMMRSDAFAKTKGFVGEYLIDFQMWLQLWEKGGAVGTGKTMSSFRVSLNSWTSKLRGTHAKDMAGLLHSLRGKAEGVTCFDVTLGIFRARIREKARVLVIIFSSAKK
jgi:glycosyltransferase involved in cell wall biosynthesis